MVRCKFKCMTKTQHAAGFEIHMSPVTCGSAENEEFFKRTPSGCFDFGTINADAAKQFEPGKDYYIDIIPTD